MNTLELSKPFLFYNELTEKQDYSKQIEDAMCRYKFGSQGQLKLLIGELYFLNVLLNNNLLNNETIIIYIGSAPGRHIKFLYNYLISLGLNPRWILIDGRDHDTSLHGLNHMQLIQRFVDEKYLLTLHSTLKQSNVVLISDIRSLRGREPKSEDLLYDYCLQNIMISILKPIASSLKWRCPFPDDWITDFYIPIGEEFLQPFAPCYSAEMRLLTLYKNTPFRLMLINKQTAIEYEKKMFYLNNNIRRKVVLDFDFPTQEYDFFHMFHILRDIRLMPSLQFSNTKKKVLFLQDAIFNFLGIKK